MSRASNILFLFSCNIISCRKYSYLCVLFLLTDLVLICRSDLAYDGSDISSLSIANANQTITTSTSTSSSLTNFTTSIISHETFANITIPEAFVVFSRVSAIESISIDDDEQHNITSNVNTIAKFAIPPIINETYMRNVIALTFDYDSRRIFYSDIQLGSIYSVSFNGSNFSLVVGKQGSAEGISYDRRAKELWWTSYSDSSINKLNMVTGKFPQKVIKLSSEDKLRGIAVHGCKAYVFWVNWNSKKPSIQRAHTSGWRIETIIKTDIKMPNAITIDHQLQRLYWNDARLDKIERCDLEGNDRVVIVKGTPQHPFAITVYGDHIFWTDWVTKAVYSANKSNGGDIVMVRKNITRPMGIVAIAPDADDCMQDPCSFLNGGCSDKCTVNSLGSVECACFSGRTLNSDGHRCMNNRTIEECDKKNFQCGDGVCIPYELTCDGLDNCRDKSDEDPNFCADRSCPSDFFTCVNGRCVHQSKVCDGYIDCPDRADEKNCTCEENMFRCDDGTCIPQLHRCDREPDCPDASDEMNCPRQNCSDFLPISDFKKSENFIPCNNTSFCILPEWICDNHNDCLDNSDEMNCTFTNSTSSNATEACDADSFRCDNGQCIPAKWRCDMEVDCEGENTSTIAVSSDERGCNYTCKEDQFECGSPTGPKACMPLFWTCDGNVDCHDGSDEDPSLCANKTCPTDTFRCESGQCIPHDWVCDGDSDCPNSDNSDELRGCPNRTCKPDEYSCTNGQCVLKKFVCDEDNDCGDNSDEPPSCSSTPSPPCLNQQFACSNKKCIPSLWTCNGFPDCADGSDEDPALCNNNRTSSRCNPNQFECRNKTACVDPERLCDGLNDCGDYSDEEHCDVDECTIGGHDCPQICEDMKIGYKCSCQKGFIAVDGGKRCKDINECETIRPCSQYCRNLYGSYSCSCAPGYHSIHNGTSCRSNSTLHPYILVSERHNIIFTDSQGHNIKIKVANVSNAVAVDFDYDQSCLYFSEVASNGSTIKRACYKNSSSTLEEALEEPTVIHSIVLKSPDGLAVDWVAKNLYWCDKNRETIEVSRLDGKFRKILIKKNLHEPRAIALHPRLGYMYWTDWGDRPHIGRAGMDGSDPIILINGNTSPGLGWPNALTIDYVTGELWWADAKLDYIAVARLDGSNSMVVTRPTTKFIGHIFAITVFEDNIFWTEWNNKSVVKCNKYHCENSTLILSLRDKPMDIHILHPYRQPSLPFTNPCDSLNCNALCLLKPGNFEAQATCACPEDFILSPDGHSCSSNCSVGSISCPSTLKCISSEWFCDKHDDCGDGFDEPSTCNASLTSCSPGHFSCTDGSCIPAQSYCNGIVDCHDGSDEKCDQTTINLSDGDSCGKDSCLNGGRCSDIGKMCICPDGYSGSQCQVKLCDCLNGGTCVKSQDSRSCLCPPGYMGQLCEKNVLPLCNDIVCNNGGYCQVIDGKAVCNCSKGWDGPTCDKLIRGLDICDHYCQNGGNCTMSQGHMPPLCSCTSDWIGSRCHIPVTCKGLCLNAGQCYLSSGNVPKCKCSQGFEGERCETSTLNTSSKSSASRSFSSSDWKIILIAVAGFIASILIGFFTILGLRLHLRNRPFMHRRIDDFGVNMEITNPMFGDDTNEDRYSPETAIQSLPLKIDNKSTNFANPLYEFEEEKTNLLTEDGNVVIKENVNGETVNGSAKSEN